METSGKLAPGLATLAFGSFSYKKAPRTSLSFTYQVNLYGLGSYIYIHVESSTSVDTIENDNID